MAKVTLLTKEQRYQAGKSLRQKCPRLSHGKAILGQGDKRDIVALIEVSNKDRLKNLIPVRHGRMLQSAFAYFRGTAGAKQPTSTSSISSLPRPGVCRASSTSPRFSTTLTYLTNAKSQSFSRSIAKLSLRSGASCSIVSNLSTER